MLQKLVSLKVSVPVDDLAIILQAARNAGWNAVDSGQRVTTEGGLEGDAIVILHVPFTSGAAVGAPAGAPA